MRWRENIMLAPFLLILGFFHALLSLFHHSISLTGILQLFFSFTYVSSCKLHYDAMIIYFVAFSMLINLFLIFWFSTQIYEPWSYSCTSPSAVFAQTTCLSYEAFTSELFTGRYFTNYLIIKEQWVWLMFLHFFLLTTTKSETEQIVVVLKVAWGICLPTCSILPAAFIMIVFSPPDERDGGVDLKMKYAALCKENILQGQVCSQNKKLCCLQESEMKVALEKKNLLVELT